MPAPAREKLHQALTRKAVVWLRKSNSGGGHGCQIALSEGWSGWSGERPDAIGWRTGVHNEGTVLVEVKVSRQDFLIDANKPHRTEPAAGIGKWRYFLCPEGVIKPEDLPPRWGLLWETPRGGIRALAGPAAELTFHSKNGYWEGDRFRKALAEHTFVERNVEREMAILARLLQRIPDVELFNERLRQANNLNQHLVKLLEKERASAKDLSNKLILARYGDQ